MQDDLDLTELGRLQTMGSITHGLCEKRQTALGLHVSRACCRVLSVGMDYTMEPQTTGNPTFLELFLVSCLSQRGEN